MRAALLSLRARFPNTPLVVLSALAEGADRLVAEVGLELGCELMVALPMRAEEYERDFADDLSIRAFRDLLERAARVVDLPRGPGGERHDRYFDAARWIASHAGVLLALWDGGQAGGPAGTADVVKLVLKGPQTPLAGRAAGLIDPVDVVPVLHLKTPRLGTSEFSLAQKPPEWRYPEGLSEIYESGYSLLERYNSELRRRLVRDMRKSERGFCFVHEAGTRIAATRYAAADALALRYGARRRGSLVLLTLLGLLATTSWILFDDIPLSELWVLRSLVAYHVVLGLALLVYRLVRWRSWPERHLDYRALAEGLRVQVAWREAGLDEDTAAYYLLKQHSITGWIRLALRITAVQAGPSESSGVEGLARVQTGWVEDQHRYFERAAQRGARAQRLAGKVITRLVIVALGASISLLLLVGWHEEVKWIQGTLIGIVAAGVGLAAGIEGFTEKSAVREQTRQYDGMRDVFGRASTRLSQLLEEGKLELARTLVFELGCEALEENALWLLLHRSRPLESPRGG